MRKDWLSERNICYKSFEYDVPRSEFLYRIGDSYFNENKYKEFKKYKSTYCKINHLFTKTV